MQRVLVTGAGGFIGYHLVTKLVTTLGWQPQTALRDGLAVTYSWIRGQVSGW
jgi:nucleoside-diphosphate-sugar epimerase